MCITTINAQTERKRQDRSGRCAEKHRLRARTRRFRGLIRTVPAPCTTAGANRGEKRLSSGRIQAIFTSDGTPLGECRLKWSHPPNAKKRNFSLQANSGLVKRPLAVKRTPDRGPFQIALVAIPFAGGHVLEVAVDLNLWDLSDRGTA